MTTIDSRATTTSERQATQDDLNTAGDEGLFAQMRATFRGPMRPWIIYVWVMGIVITALAVWSAIAFFGAETTRDWIMYAAIFLACCMFICLVKAWYYLQAAQHTHSRELRRLERRINQMQDGQR